MRKTITASLACALCYGAAFGFDLMGFVKDTIGIESGLRRALAGTTDERSSKTIFIN